MVVPIRKNTQARSLISGKGYINDARHSPGPPATRAASGIPEFDELLDKAKAKAPSRSLVSIDDVGIATAFLAHDAARLITGETLYIDGGYHIID
jgi:enoyl-[acyl-carrier protein] reductase I